MDQKMRAVIWFDMRCMLGRSAPKHFAVELFGQGGLVIPLLLPHKELELDLLHYFSDYKIHN